VKCACCGLYHWETADTRRCAQQVLAGREPTAARVAARSPLGPVLKPRADLLLATKDLQRVAGTDLKGLIDRGLRQFDDQEREAYVLRRRLNLDGTFATLREIGDELGVTGEGVRLVEAAAMAHLREVLLATAAGRRAVNVVARGARYPARDWRVRATTIAALLLPKTPLQISRHLVSVLLDGTDGD